MILSYNLICYCIQQYFIKFIFTYYLISTNFLIYQILFIYCNIAFYIVLINYKMAPNIALIKSTPAIISSCHLITISILTH